MCQLFECKIGRERLREGIYDDFWPCFFLMTSTVALPNVKTKISDQIDMVLIASFGMLNRKLSKNQMPVIAVGTVTTIQNSIHV